MNVLGTITALSVVSVLAGQAFIKTARDYFEVKPVSMTVKELRFEDGKFRQWLEVEGGPIQAEWAAQITRDGEFLCVGGGRAPYSGEPSPAMSPSFWTGGDCPEILAGDRALASWQYLDAGNRVIRLSAEIVIE